MKGYLQIKIKELANNESGNLKFLSQFAILVLVVLLTSALVSAQVEFRDENGFEFYSDLSLEDGNITMNSNRILGLPDPTSSGEPLTQGSGSGDYLDRTGDSMTGDLDIQDNWILGDSGELNMKNGGVTINGSSQVLELNQTMPSSGNPATLLFKEDGNSNWAFVSMQDGGLGLYDFEAGEVVQEFNENGVVEYSGGDMTFDGNYIDLQGSGVKNKFRKVVDNSVNPQWIFDNNDVAKLHASDSNEVYIGGGTQNRTLTKLNANGDYQWSYSDISWQSGAIATNSAYTFLGSGTCCQPQGEYLYKFDSDTGATEFRLSGSDIPGRIYQLEFDNNGDLISTGRSPNVRKIDPADGSEIWSYNGFSGGTNVGSMAIDSNNNIYGTGGSRGDTKKIDSTGTEQWSKDMIGYSVAVHSDGVYVTSEGSEADEDYRLLHYTKSGTLEWNKSIKGHEVKTDSNGDAWVSGDSKLVEFDSSGNKLSESFSPYFGGNMIIDGNDDIIVADRGKVVKLSPGSDTASLLYNEGSKLVVGSNYEPELGSELLRVDGDIKANGRVDGDIFDGDIAIDDTRSEAVAPLMRGNEVDFDFKYSSTVKPPLGNNFGTLMTMAQWGDASGDEFHQLFFNEEGPFYRLSSNGKELWRPWQKILTSSSDIVTGVKDTNDPIHIREWNGYSGVSSDISGPNKLTLGGDYTGDTERDYKVRVSTDGSPDQFEWSDDGGSTWNGEKSMSRGFQTLSNGVEVRWRADRGDTIENYEVGDQWNFTAYANKGDVLKGDASQLDLSSDTTTAKGKLEGEKDIKKVDTDTGQEFSTSAKKIVHKGTITPYSIERFGNINPTGVNSTYYNIRDSGALMVESDGTGSDNAYLRLNQTLVPSGTLSSNKRYLIEMDIEHHCEPGPSSDCDPVFSIGDGNNAIFTMFLDQAGVDFWTANDVDDAESSNRELQVRSFDHPLRYSMVQYLLNPDSADEVFINARGIEDSSSLNKDLDPSNNLEFQFRQGTNEAGVDYIIEEVDITIYEISQNEEAMTQ